MHRIEPLNSDKFSTFNRLIPKEGMSTGPKVKYTDVNDIPEMLRLSHRNYFSKDPEYKPLIDHKDLISKGTKIGKRFCAYVFKDHSLVGSISFTEYLDSPFGFREGDFHLSKWIYPKYRRTKYSRYAMGHLMHLVLSSRVVNNLYSFLVAKEGTTYENDLWFSVDTTQPCHGEVFPSDGPNVMKYIKRDVLLQTSWREYILTVCSGEVFRKMDFVTYLMASPNREEEAVRKWLKHMDKLSKVVRKEVLSHGSSKV